MLVAVLSACDAPPQVAAPAPSKVPHKPAEAPPSKQQLEALSGECEKLAREGGKGAEIASHYNVKLKSCFYVITEVSGDTLRKKLFDLNGGDLYGEYLGPAVVESPATPRPKTCRIESFHCASAREWDVLAEPYMQE